MVKIQQKYIWLHTIKRGISSIVSSELKQVTNPHIISKDKKTDLLCILDLIDPCFHDFYKTLNDGNIPNTDPDIAEDD